MNIIDKVSAGITASVDMIVDKNRELAQLNRLEAIIKNETDVLNHAYIALGKQYFKMLEGEAEEVDMTQVCDAVKLSEQRLKKAQARYDYIKAYGMPDSPVNNVENNYNAENAEAAENENEESCEVASVDVELVEDENGDITIAAADEVKAEPAEEDIQEKAANAVSEIKKKRGKKEEADAEAASDETAE